MVVQTIAIISPGEMGASIGEVLVSAGFKVIAPLSGRSNLTKTRAIAAGFKDISSIPELLEEADLLLSIVPPASALNLAREIAAEMNTSGHRPPYADCNAISPETTRCVGKIISDAGAIYIDGGIIGTPPWKTTTPRIYVSGERADLMAQLDGENISIIPIGNEIGRASGLKLCSASLTKVTLALQTAVMIAAEAMDLTEEFHRELIISREPLFRQIESGTRRLPSVSERYAGEMEEIAAAFSSLGVTPKFHQGAFDVYRLLSGTPLASETPDTIDENRALDEAARLFAKHLPM